MSSFLDHEIPRDEPFALGPALELVRMMWALRDALGETSRSVKERLGLTERERLAVRFVGKYPGISAAALSDLMGIGNGPTRMLLGRLRRRGLVSLRPDPRRARRVLAGLTARGRTFDVPSPVGLEAAAHRALGSLSPAKREAALRIVGEIARTVQTELARHLETLAEVEPEVEADERNTRSPDLGHGSQPVR